MAKIGETKEEDFDRLVNIQLKGVFSDANMRGTSRSPVDSPFRADARAGGGRKTRLRARRPSLGSVSQAVPVSGRDLFLLRGC